MHRSCPLLDATAVSAQGALAPRSPSPATPLVKLHSMQMTKKVAM